jgi:hypothetical protein
VSRPAWIDGTIESAVRAFNRNPWTNQRLELLPRIPRPLYAEDGLWTHHGHTFIEEQGFQRAYARAVRAGGWDYGIRWRVHTLLWAARLGATVDGAFVECGTGRGFMASAICDYLGWTDRPFFLHDTFEPAMPDEAGDQTGPICPCYASSVSAVRDNFAEWPGVRLVVGRIPETLGDSPDAVAFLHVDLNHAAAESAAVRHFWPRMPKGAVLVFDDYGFEGFEASRGAADALGRELRFSVLASPTGQGIVIKSVP